MPFAASYLSEHKPLLEAKKKSISTVNMDVLRSIGVTQEAVSKVNPVHCVAEPAQ